MLDHRRGSVSTTKHLHGVIQSALRVGSRVRRFAAATVRCRPALWLRYPPAEIAARHDQPWRQRRHSRVTVLCLPEQAGCKVTRRSQSPVVAIASRRFLPVPDCERERLLRKQGSRQLTRNFRGEPEICGPMGRQTQAASAFWRRALPKPDPARSLEPASLPGTAGIEFFFQRARP